jgi:rhodanese-related sulfurtransferase
MKLNTEHPQNVYRCACEGPIWLVDVRTPGEFRSLRAQGAVNLPLSEVSDRPLTPPENYQGPLYLICQSGARARQAAQKLSAHHQVVLVDGGTQAWLASGLPVEREAAGVISLDRQVRMVIGSLVVLGVVLSQAGFPQAVYLSAVMGLGLIFAGVTDRCPLAMGMGLLPWNRR